MMDLEILIVGLVIISVLISLVTGLIGVFAFIELRSFMKSTHKVEFVPLDHNAAEAKDKYDPLDDFNLGDN